VDGGNQFPMQKHGYKKKLAGTPLSAGPLVVLQCSRCRDFLHTRMPASTSTIQQSPRNSSLFEICCATSALQLDLAEGQPLSREGFSQDTRPTPVKLPQASLSRGLGSDTAGTHVLAAMLSNENIKIQPDGLQRLVIDDALLDNGSTLSEASVEHQVKMILADESVQQRLGLPQALPSPGEHSRHAEAASGVSPTFLAPPAIASACAPQSASAHADPRLTPVLLEGMLV
jgi:hypothetical protein